MAYRRLTSMAFLLLAFLMHEIAANEDDVNPCAAILCIFGSECDPLIPGCVPVTCDAPDACPTGSTCVPQEIQCVRDPCPQFICEPNCSNLGCDPGFKCNSVTQECEAQGCETTCGEVVPFYSVYFDDGENYCRPCFCSSSGESLCFPFDCPDNPTLSECPSEGCTTTCGRPIDVGETFQDDGTNFCNICTCQAPGQEICTLIFCDPEAPEADCDCVFGPAVVVDCEEGCEECEITPRTCDECAVATCLDP